MGNFYGSTASLYAVMDKGIGKAAITLQTFLFELRYNLRNHILLRTANSQFPQEFLFTMFPPGKQDKRPLSYRFKLFAQTSASSSAFATLPGKALARMAASISWAISGFSLRKFLTLSLPCPMRSFL